MISFPPPPLLKEADKEQKTKAQKTMKETNKQNKNVLFAQTNILTFH